MWTIVNKSTGKVLYASYEVVETDQVTSIKLVYSEPITENSELYFNFETEKFYLHENTR